MILSYWFQYSSVAIYPYLQQNAPASGAGLAVIGPYPQDTAPSDVVMAYTYPQRFLVVSGVLVEQPYWTLATATSGSSVTVTGTLNNPPTSPPTSATMTVLGQSITEAVTSGTATFALTVDPSVQGNAVTLSVGASGTVSGATTIGAMNTFPLKAVLSGSTITVVPTNVSDYQGYLFAQFPNLFVAMQLTAAMQHLSTDMHRLEMANVTGLTANQQATITDINTNVVPHLALSLETAQTTGATLWAQVKQGLIQFSQLQTQLETALATWYA